MKARNWLMGVGLAMLAACTDSNSGTTSGQFDVDKVLAYCDTQVRRTLDELSRGDEGTDYTMMPRNIPDSTSHWYCSKATKEEWCAGFWPGILWYDYEYTKDPVIKAEAERFTDALESISHITPAYDHDLGFLMFCSYGNGYRLTHNETYREVILRSADALAELFNPKAGTILSWPRNVEMLGGHNTIMDNMINLEMLFWASKNGGDKKLYDIAVSHADTTMKYHFRPDYTSYHVAVYDTLTGHFIKGMTHQGYSDSSMWARGQAWAIYGYTVVYRETQDPKYLDFVQQVTAPRDASAACVVASALLELSGYVSPEKGSTYREAALRMLESLSSDKYQCGKQKPAFLLHSTGHYPNGSEIDASIIYADYYYIEALLRLKRGI